MKTKYVLATVILLLVNFARAQDVANRSCADCGVQRTKPGCGSLFDQFCKKLYSSKNKGDMDVVNGQTHLPIQLGTKNGFGHDLIAYNRAKLAAIKGKTLPADFLKNLSPEYPELMEKYLKTPELEKMKYSEFREFKKMGTKISGYMDSAWEKTVQDRIEAKIPGYYTRKSSTRTLEEQKLAAKITKEFSSSFYKEIWKDNENYKQSKAQFYEVQKTMLEYVKSEADISDSDRKEILARITSIEFNEPGIDPSQTDPTCFSTEQNAFYDPETNKVSMCAGMFNTIPSLYLIYSHELTHSLSIDRSHLVAEEKSEAGKKMKALIDAVCKSSNSEKCPKEWQEFTDAFEKAPNAANGDAVLKEMRVCLQRAKPKKPVFDDQGKETEEYTKTVTALSEEGAESVVDATAEGNEYLSLTLPKVPKSEKDPTLIPNPNYLNPCAKALLLTDESYRMDSILAFESLVVAAYKCSKHEKEEDKLDDAIQKSQEYMTKRFAQGYRSGASLSSDSKMRAYGYADNSEERVADTFGDRVFKRVLEDKYPKTSKDWEENRRNMFFTNSAFLCDPVSMTTVNPKKAAVEAKYSSEEHSTNINRRMDLVNPPMSDTLGCEVDYDNQVCQ